MREGAVHVTRRSCGHVTPLPRTAACAARDGDPGAPSAPAAECLFLEDDLGALIRLLPRGQPHETTPKGPKLVTVPPEPDL